MLLGAGHNNHNDIWRYSDFGYFCSQSIVPTLLRSLVQFFTTISAFNALKNFQTSQIMLRSFMYYLYLSIECIDGQDVVIALKSLLQTRATYPKFERLVFTVDSVVNIFQ